ncbi:hypothetical protein [Nocardia lijiangensis]|uniref:hypothetical protein n=1 Tax=Nocardia lijiangensis TaxID=299618 RepID=UPI00082C2162|nr:hypothetical protein [Nocardia lijiangensis]
MTTTTVPVPDTGHDLLRTVLRVDGWSTGAFGAIMLAAAPILSEPLGLPTTWSIPFGVAMLGGAAALLLLAKYPEIPAPLAVTVVTVNALSAVGMVLLTFTDLMPLTGWGIVFLHIGAAFVAIFATLEYVGLRRANR